MDKLKSLISQKKRHIQEIRKDDKKWIKPSEECEREIQQAQEQVLRDSDAKRKCLVEKFKKVEVYFEKSVDRSGCEEDVKNEGIKIPVVDVIRRLRRLHQPATLFGETDNEKWKRLYQQELDVKNIESTQNIFVDAMMGRNNTLTSKYINKPGVKSDGFFEECDLPQNSKNYKVFRWISEMLKIWEAEHINTRDELIKKGEAFEVKRNEALLIQTKKDIKPLVKLLKSQEIDGNILDKLYKIVDCCEKGEYKDAHDAYMLLAIGNAAWPMGVTMVGIHERAGRSKIFTSEVAHILNDETTRKYIQMFKRLISFSQTKFATDPSKQVLMSTIHI